MTRLSYKSLFIILVFLLIPILFLLKINQKGKTVLADWWNDSWTYRQAINISTHSVGETNVYITTTINIGTTTKAQTDDGDFRFTTTSGQLLDYYISSGAGTTAPTFHVLIDSYPAGAQTVYAYYGNPSATNGFSASDFTTAANNSTISSYSTEETGGSPVAWWKFDEGVGTSAFDSSPNQLNARLSGSTLPTWTSEDQCLSGKCLYSSGVGYITSANSSVNNFGTNSFTVSVWIKPQDFTYPKTSFAFLKGNAPYILGPTRAGWSIADGYTASGAAIVINDGTSMVSTTLTFNSSSRPTDFINKWTHLTYVFNRTTNLVYAYVNGVQQNNTVNIASVTGSISNTSPLYVGYGTGWTYKGFFDDVRLYPYARTATQIKQDYNAGVANMGGQQINKSSSDGLVGYWKFDEGVGTTSADSSGNSNLTTFGTGSSSPGWIGGKFGVGTSFGGINKVDVGSANSLNIVGDMTLSIWVNPKNASGWEGLASKWGDSWAWALDTATHRNALYINGWNYSNSSIPANQWSHLAVVYKDSDNKVYFYLNGVPDGTSTQLSNQGTSGIVTLGYWGNNYFYSGLLDEVRIYNKALNPTEIKALYEYAPGPVGYWKFDEGVGSTVFDSSGNSGNGGWQGTLGNQWASGKIGKAGNFNGSNNYLNLGTNLGNYTDNFTVSSWIKTGTNNVRILGRRDTPSGTQYDLYLQSTTGKAAFFDGTTQYAGTSNLANNQWHFVSWVFNGANSKIYVDGIAEATFTVSTTSKNISTIIGGWDNGVSGLFNGLMDDLKIYNYARTPEQIIQDMSASGGSAFGGGNKFASPIVWYKFDEGYGTVANNSGIGGTINGTLRTGSSSPTWVSGKINKGLSFDGSNDLISVADNASLNTTQDYSISMWIYNQAGSANYPTLINRASQSGVNGFFWIYTTGTSETDLNFQYANGSNYVTELFSGALRQNVWDHINFTFNNTTKELKLYVNGKQFSTTRTLTTPLPVDDGILYFGSYQTNPNIYAFKGIIDEFKLYNYALSSDEIKQDYNQGAAFVFGNSSQTIGGTTTSLDYCIPGDTSPCAAPIAEYKFDEGVGTTAFDTSSNNWPLPLGVNTSSPSWTIGKVGKALYFNGDDYVGYNDNGTIASDTGPVTINAWVKTTSNQQGGIVSRYGNSSTWTYSLYMDSNGKANFNRSASTPWSTTVTSSQSINNNNWNFITAKYDGISMQLYINSIADNSLPETRNSQTPGPWSFCIGSEHYVCSSTNYHGHFTGSIDQVRIYNYARTPAQIAYDYNKGGPVGYWKFDECQGIVAHNSADLAAGGSSLDGIIAIGANGTQNSLGTCQVGTSAAWTSGATGKINSSLNFDGTDDYVQIGTSNPVTGSSPFTLASWLKVGTHSNYGLAFYIGGATSGQSAWLGWTTSVQQGTSNSIGGGFYGTNYGSGITDNNWHHVVLTYAGGTGAAVYLYVDGIQKVSTTYTASLAATSIMMGKANTGTAYWYNGQLDDARVYNYALTATQVKTLYNGGAINFR
ncbi:MAG: LamG domain-containing protein [Microgenomates group bacterium]